MSKYAVEVKNIRKRFSYSNYKNNSLKSAITQIFKPKDTSVNSFNALDGISFNVEKGDFFGILGRNGSGKSTLLKIISEIYQPTSGNVKHDGKVVSFIELGVGFKAELSGRENVFLNGGLLGFSKEEVAAMYDDIVEFAELEKFMDQKLKNYSSGMKVRLAFSVAIRAHADILILDEVLAVGDADFQRKCTDYFETLKEDGKTVILVTHSMGNVRQFCNKAVVIEDGKLIYEGDPDAAAEKYLSLFDHAKKVEESTKVTNKDISNVKFKNMQLLQDKRQVETVKFKEDFILKIEVDADKAYDEVSMGLYIFDRRNRAIIVISSNSSGGMKLHKGRNTIKIDIENILRDGDYYINFAIENKKDKQLLVQMHKILHFSVVGLHDTDLSKRSLVYPDIKVTYE